MNEPHRELRGHDFWPAPELLDVVPALYATGGIPEREKIVHLHYFVGACDWWVVELDSTDRPHYAFGYACLGDPQMAEWGAIDLDELAQAFRPGTLTEVEERGALYAFTLIPPFIVQRDLGWTPRPAGEVIPYLR